MFFFSSFFFIPLFPLLFSFFVFTHLFPSHPSNNSHLSIISTLLLFPFSRSLVCFSSPSYFLVLSSLFFSHFLSLLISSLPIHHTTVIFPLSPCSPPFHYFSPSLSSVFYVFLLPLIFLCLSPLFFSHFFCLDLNGVSNFILKGRYSWSLISQKKETQYDNPSLFRSNGVTFVPQSKINKAAGTNPMVLVLLKMATG
jgi:hypothetical protein